MKKSLKLIAAAVAAVSAMSCTGATAFADSLRTIDGVKYRYSDSGEDLGIYTGWANTSKGRVFYNKGVRVTKNTIINGIRYKFSSDGYLTGTFTGWTKSASGKRFWYDGKLIKNKWIKSGSYYYYAGIDGYIIVDKVTEKFPALKALSAGREKELCEQFIEWQSMQGKVSADDLYIPLYLGNYNGNDVALIMPKDGLSEIDFTELGTITCGDRDITTAVGSEPVVSINNEIDHLDVAFLDGLISDSDIIRINYYMNKFLADNGADPTALQNKYPPLTALTEKEKQTLFEDFIGYKAGKGGWKGITAEDLSIKRYYGTYNGCEAVVIWCNEIVVTDDIQDIGIAGYTISLPSGSYELLLHRDSTFISIREAYNKGYLSKSDIDKIAYYAKH